MPQLVIRSLFSTPDSGTQKAEWLAVYGKHFISSLHHRVNGAYVQTPYYDFKSPVLRIPKAIVCQGRYPLDKDGNLWVGGVTYFQRGIELEGRVGEVPLNRDNAIALVSHGKSELRQFNKVVLVGGRNNFGHWLFEILPKIFSANEIVGPEYSFLVSDCVPRRFIDWCSFFGVDIDRFEFYGDGETFEASDLIVPSVSCHRHRESQIAAIDSRLMVSMVNRIKGAALVSPSPPPPPISQSFFGKGLYYSGKREMAEINQ